MPDIEELVERLRYWEGDGHPHGLLHREAADKLTTLREEVERLRKALRPFADLAAQYDPPEGDDGLPLMQYDGDELNIGGLSLWNMYAEGQRSRRRLISGGLSPCAKYDSRPAREAE